MTAPQDIRELSQRAELEFHTRAHRFRRRAWLSGVLLSLVCCAWLVSGAMLHDQRIYDSGPLSHAHAFIANDCQQCHNTWQPLRRLISGNPELSSIDNDKCIRCHTASAHHLNQVPAHEELSCAVCHREHQGKQQLADVTDRHCVRCHADLQTTGGPARRFARAIRGFSAADGHPEFNLSERLRDPQQVPSNLLSAADLRDLDNRDPAAAEYQRQFLEVLSTAAPQAGQPVVRDRGHVKFSHAAHLNPLTIKDHTGKHIDLSQNCQACHVPESGGRYMRPIRYDEHCAKCHPLLFDNQNYPGEVVPHGTPQVVRGFLTEKFTLAALKRQAPFAGSQTARPLPGQPDPQPLTADAARRIEEQVMAAERIAQEHGRAVKSGGGCRLCHTLEEAPNQPTWSILPSQIPDRWMPHSRFDHAAHRFLNCVECHQDVNKSKTAGDVLIPNSTACRSCHISDGSMPSLFQTSTSSALTHPVASTCAMCHTYHRREKEPVPRNLDFDLKTQQPAAPRRAAEELISEPKDAD